jgi:hypothetical protein|tara:strand:- start:1189 stop:1653 length:465 start_codon:yes stop_codon:yes gene_type:complete
MKSQVSQIFIYIITLLIVALVLFYGYRAIFSFKEKADTVSFIQLKNDLENMVETLSVDFGSVKVRDFTAPPDIMTVCFVTNFPSMPTLSNTEYPLIEDSVNSKVQKNVFLIGQNVEESFYVEKVVTDSALFCVNATGNKINLRMEGMGDHTLIS